MARDTNKYELEAERTRQLRIDKLTKFMNTPQVMLADKKYRKVISTAIRKIKQS